MTSKCSFALALTLVLVWAALGCGDDGAASDADVGPALDSGMPDGMADSGPVDAGPLPSLLARFCGTRDYASTLTAAVLEPLSGEPIGAIESTLTGGELEAGTTESIAITPAHPFIVRALRVAFASGTGTARIRLVESFGRSYPASFLGVSDTGDVDVVPPVEIDVDVSEPDAFIDIDVSDAEAVLMPGRVYHIIYEHLTPEPFLSMESVPEGETNRSIVLFARDVNAYGVPGNFRMVAEGDYACAWSDEMRWLQRDDPPTFAEGPGGNVHVADIDSDGHDDVVAVGNEQPAVFFGDGRGGFTRSADGVFPADEVKAHHMIFADIDSDGDQDALVMVYIQSDADGDGVTVMDGDCDDSLPGIHPGGVERPGNGYDDDCDGVTDDGTSTDDADGDGQSIAMGDCNDNDAEMNASASEVLDSRDNDCDGTVDEDFFHHVLLNDGAGHFTRLADAGVEVQGPTAASGMADANGDGVLDLFVGFWLRHYPDAPTDPSLFFYGNGDGTFREATEEAGMTVDTPHPVYGVMWNDWNDDGWDDLYVGHYQLNDNLFFSNDGSGHFANVASEIGVDHDTTPTIDYHYPGGHSYGGDFGDLDGDGDIRRHPLQSLAPSHHALGRSDDARLQRRCAELHLREPPRGVGHRIQRGRRKRALRRFRQRRRSRRGDRVVLRPLPARLPPRRRPLHRRHLRARPPRALRRDHLVGSRRGRTPRLRLVGRR